MDRIIAGRFKTKDNADAAAKLLTQYIETGDICIFHNNPPGQHAVVAGGGDENEDPGAKGAGKSAATTAIAAGLTAGAIGSLGGPAVALAAAAAGAYSGSLAGALEGLGRHDDTPHQPDRRPGGVILSVRIADLVDERRVVATLLSEGAADVEHAAGVWRDGDWTDFDPVAVPQLVANEFTTSADR